MNTKLAFEYREILQRIIDGDFYGDYDRDVESLGVLRRVQDELLGAPCSGRWKSDVSRTEKAKDTVQGAVTGTGEGLLVSRQLLTEFFEAFENWTNELSWKAVHRDRTPMLGKHEPEELYRKGWKFFENSMP